MKSWRPLTPGNMTGIFILLVLAAFLTAFYMGRQILMVFFGKPRSQPAARAHGEPGHYHRAAGHAGRAVGAGRRCSTCPGLAWLEQWLEHTVRTVLPGNFTWTVALGSLTVAVLGLLVAWLVYGRRSLGSPETPDPLELSLKGLFRAMEHKWWVDEAYHTIFVHPYELLTRFLSQPVDQGVIDGTANGLATAEPARGAGLAPGAKWLRALVCPGHRPRVGADPGLPGIEMTRNEVTMNVLVHPLFLVTFFPLLGLLVIAFLKEEHRGAIRWTALVTALIDFGLALWVLAQFNGANPGMQLDLDLLWLKIAGLEVHFHFGVDGLSILMLLLTTFLSPIAILSTWTGVKERVKGFMLFFLLLETGMTGVFLSLDLVLFYIFWEFTLIPMYFLIGMWGGERRIYAAVKFFLFTMAGSLLMLLAILYIGLSRPASFSLPDLVGQPLGLRRRPDLAVPGLCPGLRHQGAHVAAAHLAAGRPRRSAYGRLGHPGGCAAEDGRLRLPALQPAALPPGHSAAGALDGGCWQ